MPIYPTGSASLPFVSSPFGPRKGGAFSFHYGVDFGVTGSAIASDGGLVTFAGWANSAAGNTVILDIGGGIELLYMHLASIAVRKGDRVAEGAKLGVIGRSGNATGVCLHYEVRVNGKSIDPLPWLAGRVNAAAQHPARARYGEAWVKAIQDKLLRMGHDLGPTGADGKDGPKTQAAVRFEQQQAPKNGYKALKVDGIAGPDTNGYLDWWLARKAAPAPAPAASGRPTIRKGSSGQAVRDLQARLKSNYALYAGRLVVDGKFGPATEAAVREFQRRAGLKVDGIVGPATWARLGL
ncbi:lysin A [Microbacterium phage Zeta1847]|uniref:Lysin A n=1 Tax=Microbacterium phage Zeta1847 TaxID=2201444 RepID=A0A2Z4QAM1_9CAUD|nr:peptidase [Microbacterium phage Zeta1847]AWY06653.1 lysin A [Microbacterium phage Zeta1847]